MNYRWLSTSFALLLLLLSVSVRLFSQETYKDITAEERDKIFEGNVFHPVEYFSEPKGKKAPKNVILLIGDGMGVSHLFAALTANKGELYVRNFRNIGFSTTHSANKYVTDSGAAGTALAAGTKTYNGAIGVDADTVAIENIREKAEKKGLSTGVVSTSAVTHATPAAFVAHVSGRSSYEDIAADYLKTNIDVFIGGGYKHFASRKDSVDLIPELAKRGYQVITETEGLNEVGSNKIAALLAPEHMPKILEGRGDMLKTATKTAISALNKNKKGFFLMIEGSQIDWGGHQNNTGYVVTETLDFDQAVGVALAFATKNKETLVIVTADHETGGFAVEGGNYTSGKVIGDFTSTDHTASMVPVMAFGPGAEKFRGFYDNVDIPAKIIQLLKLD
jgi:alkaline phosphatase